MRVLDPNSLAQHIDRLYRAAWALCGSREQAEDLVQETFARVLSRPRVLHGENELYYLLRVLRNTYLSSVRTAGRRPRAVATLDDVAAVDSRPTSRPHEALEVRELYATISELPEDFRLALVAIDVIGLSYQEAARALGVREATITTRLHRARRRVSQQLSAPAEPAEARPARGAAEGSPDGAEGLAGAELDDRSGPQEAQRERLRASGVFEGGSAQ